MESPLRIELGGDLFSAFEEAQAGLGEAFGLIAAMVILLLAFGSIIAMGLPIGMAVFGLALAISSLSLVTYLIELPSWAPVLGSMIGLGVGIDYALIIVTRHREYLARGMEVEESVGRAVATAGQAVLFAGGTVVIAILGLVVAGVPFMTAGGHRHLAHRADHGARFAHLAARVPGSGRALDQSPSSTAGAGVPWFGLAAVGGACVQARRRLRRRRHRPAAGARRTRARAPRRYAR